MTSDKFRFPTLTAVVIANMVGTGVFTSLGFQLLDIQSGFALLALWAIGGVAGYVYLNKDALIDKAKSQVTDMITDAVGGAVGDLPNLMGGGGGIPAPSSPAGSGLPVPFKN